MLLYRIPLAIVLILLLTIALPLVAFPSEKGPYPLNPVDRALVLPKGSGEISLGPAFLDGNDNSDIEPYFNVRYGLTDNLEIANLGLRYRFIETEDHQWAVRLQNFGLDTNGHHHTMVGIDGKQFLWPDLSLTYGLGYYFADSHEKDGRTHEGRASVGAILRLWDKAAVETQYSYRRLSGFSASSANLLKITASYNIVPALDLAVGYGRSDFNEAVDSVLFNESYENRFDVHLKWRFNFP